MANNNIYVRCLFCSPRKGLPIDWKTEHQNLFYLASFGFTEGWRRNHDPSMSEKWDGWLQKHNHFDEDGNQNNYYEIVDEVQ